MPDNKTLSQQDRTKLDGIVQKMISNKEPENNIKFVVEDFKNKYGIGGEVKKKESSQLTSQESVWGSNSQPKDAYTSLVIDQQIPQQESVISDGEQPKPILKGLPSVESLKKKTIQPKKETAEIIKDVVPKVAKAISIEKNKEDFSEATQKARKESKSLVDKKQIDQKISEVSGLQNEYAKSLKDIELAKKQLSDEKAEIDYQLSIGNNTPEFQQKIALHNSKVQENLDKFNSLKDKSEIINYNKKVIESASGNLLRNKAEQGNWFGAIYNKMLESASSMASGAVSRVTDLIAEVVPSEYLIGPKELKRLKDKGLDQNQIDDYIKKSAKKDVLPAIRKGNVELFGDKGTTEEYIKKKESSGLIEGGILGLAGSVPAMLGGVYGRATNFFLMGSDAVEKEMESNPDFQNISENEKLAVIVPIGIANAVLEEFGLQGVMKNNSIVNNLVHKTLLKVGADASADTFKRAMNSEIKSGIASGLFKVGSGFTSEAITGGSQQAAEIGIKDIYNVVKDKKMFQTPETLSDAVSQISDAAIMEGIGGTVMSTLPAINTAMQNNELGKKSTDFEFEILDNINENSEEFKKLFTTDLKNKMIEGKITKDEAESQLKSFDKMTATFNRMPKDMSIEDKKKSFDLLVEKDKLTNEINGKDESLSTKQKERISEINKELSDISLGVKPKEEVKTEEVVVENKPKETVTPQAYVEELTKTKESDPETYWSVSEVSAEDAYKGTIIDTTDGSALVKPDGDIAGLFKKPTSNAKGVAQDLLSKAVEAGGIKLDNFDGYLTKQYEKAGFRIVSRVPFSLEYGVPDGYNKEKHGTPDVVAMVYDPNNELEIEEKTFDDYDEAMAYRDSFVDQAKINTEVKGLSNLFDESEKSNDLPSLVQKAKTSLSKILPNVDVVLYDTESDYYNAVGEEDNSGGAFMNNTVHINPNRANGRTVAHEVFHAVLLNKVKSDPEAQRITSEMINSVEKVLTPDMKAKLQDFVESGYDTQKNLWNEEKLAELIGFLAENYDTLPQPTQNIIKQWLDQLAKLVGIKEFTDKEVIDFMNTLSGKIASGEVITEKDINIIQPTKVDSKGNLPEPTEKSKNNLKAKRAQITDDTKSKVKTGSIVSTRTPDTEGIHSTSDNIVDLKSLEKDELLFIKIAKELSSYGLSKIEEVNNINDARNLIRDFKNSVKDNLRFLHDSFGNEVRDVAKLWYDGANKISNEIADKYDYSTDQVAGVMAVLSPQMDWFRNLSLGKRVIDIYKNQQDSLFDSKMKSWVENSSSGTGKNKKPLFSDSKEIIKRVNGKKLLELDIRDKAIFIRAYDEMYNSKNYENISPNGEINGLVRNKNGSPGACGWGAFPTIEKSISILEDGSIENISKNLGNMHKVRNFFNNISNPNDPNAVTIDTHAVAAGLLLPLSGSSKEVLYNFGGASSKSTGSKGSYAVYADAYRELAKEIKILPRELQSITWEAVRGLFKVDFKANKSNEENVKKVWSKYKDGEISINKAHSDISDLAGGISKPVWYEYVADDNVKLLDENSAAMDQANEDNIPERKQITSNSDSFFENADVIFPNDHVLGGYAVTDTNNKLIGRVKMSKIDNNTVKIDEVVSEKRGEGTGNGTNIMNMIIENADKTNTTLTLTPNLILGLKAKGFETVEKLRSFYSKFGFIKDKGLSTMTRNPETSKLSRKQIIGEKAVKDKLVQNNLDTAKEMEAANKSAEDIFIATGWEKGADNKWKYDLQEGVVEFKNKKNGKASEVINYPELFKAYPKAKNIDIVFMNSDKFDGMYLRSKNRIMLSNNLSDSELKSTLLHEVQHFIQNEEGFAVGGTAQTIKDLYNARIKYEKNFSVKKVLNNIKNSLFKPNPESVKEDLNKLSKLVSKSDEELYKSIAGEVEAFNVEKRAKMTPEQRKSSPISKTAEVPVGDQLIVSDSDTMLKGRLQKAKGINEMVKIAKEAKYSDAAIKSYLNSKGFTEDQIKSAFESYLSEDEAYNKFNDTFKQAKKELENKRTVKEYFKDKYRNLLKNWSNRQVEVQSLLANTGMINTLNLNINSHGYSGRAKKTFEESYNKIYKGLNTEKRDMLDKVIQAKRFIAIDNNRAERGLDPVKHPNFLNKDVSEKYLDKLKSEIGSKSFEDLNSRANEYFKTYKKLLKDVYENGLINKETYDSMSDIDYQPRVFLKFVTDFEGDIKTNKNNVDSTGLGSSQIKAMTEGSASSLVSNSEWLLSNSLVARTNAIAKNSINKRFMTDEFQKAKERFKKLDTKNLKGDDKRFYEYFKELNSKVIENPVVGKNENGSLKFKYDGVKNPENFTKAFYFVDGVQYSFFLEDGLYKSWTDSIDGFIDKDTKEILSYGFGSALVKAIATGNNPAFLIVNTPRDFMFTAAFSEQYNDFIPVALAQIGKDVVKSIGEIRKKDSDILNKYFEYGGAMDFLNSQGVLKKNSMLGQFLDKMVPSNVRDNLKGLFNVVTLKKISNYSELMFRLGIFQRSVANSLKELGYKDISEIKDKQQVDDIYNSAVASARGILDFNRGGLATKDLESITPYINVAFQGGSVALREFKKRPAATTSRVIQIATMASTIPAGISLMLIAANKDDDDEKTVHEIYLDAIAGISKYQKSKYMNIVTGLKNEDGQYMIIKIAKAQELSPVISVTDNIVENSVRKMAGKELKSNSDIAREALFSLKSNVLPIDVTSPSATVVRNPMIKAILTYQTGYDFFREEPLSMKLESKPAPYEGMDMKSVESFYKKLGPSAGLSPVRSKAFVESLITTPATNPFIGFLYGGAEAMTSDKEAKEIGGNLIKNLKRSTLKRLVSYTSDFNRNLDAQNKLNSEIEEIKLKDAIQNSKIKEISDEFISNKISESKFVSGLKDLDDFDAKRAFDKAIDRKKLKNIDANIIDIKYEKDAKIKALMIKYYYGNILDGSKDSERVKTQMIIAKGIFTPEVIFELENKEPAN